MALLFYALESNFCVVSTLCTFSYFYLCSHLAEDMFSLVEVPYFQFRFLHLGFWSGNYFLIVSFPDHCLLVLFRSRTEE